MPIVAKIVIGVLPVLIFLAALSWLDNYRLVRLRSVLMAIGVGAAVAVGCMVATSLVLENGRIGLQNYSRYLAPLLEETGKALLIAVLIRFGRIGFMADGAILGFAVGAGFATVENVYYLWNLPGAQMLTWVVRGLGTAVMHGGTTAIMAILSTTLAERRGRGTIGYCLPGLAVAVVLHSVFNHFLLGPLHSTLLVLVILPTLMVVCFVRSERSLRRWLDTGFGTDTELLEMIRTGTVLSSKIGQYLQSVIDRLPGEIQADMLCYLRLYVELSIQSKVTLLLQETGLESPADLEVRDKFTELRFLEKHIGAVGMRILSPLLHTSPRDLWQLHHLKGEMPA